MSDKRKYSVKELSTILGCSVTAVQKKIFTDENNPNKKRYRNRYDVVMDDGKSVILLADEELEEEKRLSKGFKNVQQNVNEHFKNVNETSENVIDVDFTQDYNIKSENVIDKIFEFTKSYIERYETLQKQYYNLLNEKDKQVKLLTDSENKTQKEFYEISAKCKTLEEKNKHLTRLIYVVIGVLIFVITLYFWGLKSL